MKRFIAPMQIKAVSDKGVVTGYASIFGNIDLGGDVIVGPDPFKEIVRTSDGKVLHLYAHDSYGYTPSAGLPIGKADVEQDEKGLAFETQLVMSDPFVRDRIYPHLKEGTLDGMSIGYDVLPFGSDYDEENRTRVLRSMKLWEITSCVWGMNPEARVEGVKQRAKNTTNIREFEDLLRDVGGFSGRQAKLLASGGWDALQKARDEPGGADELTQLNWDFMKVVPR
jgi:HK97 family phage prohead protease